MNSDESPMDEIRSLVEEEAPREPTALGRFFTKVIRWTAGIAIVFGFGVGLTWLVRVAPLVRDLRNVQDDLTAASVLIADLEQAVAGLNELEQYNDDLQSELEGAEEHINLLMILSDVSTARLALAKDDRSAARTALAETDERLSRLQEFLEGEDANTVVGLRVRLQQAISEIDTNIFAADGDLAIIYNDLQNLESGAFSS
jgi:chromosome segregation ATPase